MINVIPLTSDPNQTMDVTIPVDGKNLTLTLGVSFNAQGNYWWLTISKNGIILLECIPLVSSSYPAGNLLEQHSYLRIGSAFLVKTGDISDDTPNQSNLGSNFHLVWGDTIV